MFGNLLKVRGEMAHLRVDDALWALIELLLPTMPGRQRYPGGKRLDDRKALTGMVCVVQTGIAWEMLPQEMGRGAAVTCWRRLRQWQQALSTTWSTTCGGLFSDHQRDGIDSTKGCCRAYAVLTRWICHV